MAAGIKPSEANLILEAFGRHGTAYQGPTALYVKLHTGDPGAAATSNAATETTRQAVTFGAAAGGVIANTGAITWTSIAGSQTATYFSAWDASSAGNFLFSGTVTANAYTAGDTVTFAIGALTFTLNVAA